MVTKRRLLLAGLAIALIYTSAYSASAAVTPSSAELQLAGIRLGRSAMTIIQKFGNPTEIRIGQSADVNQQGDQGAAPAAPSAVGLPGQMPGMPPDITGGQAMTASPTPGQASPKRGAPEVKWLYKFPKNRSIEFIINPDGRIMQIQAFGADWSTVRTSKGIALGVSTYKDVLAKYGFPESHDRTGIELITRYTGKHRVIFTLVGQTVVGITIGLMD